MVVILALHSLQVVFLSASSCLIIAFSCRVVELAERQLEIIQAGLNLPVKLVGIVVILKVTAADLSMTVLI